MKQTSDIPTNIDYAEKYKTINDQQLTDILIHRDQYQPQAAQAAIGEAIRRGILNSEQDLFSPEFNAPKKAKAYFFPVIHREEQKSRIRAGLHRLLYIIALLPIIQAGKSYLQQQWTELTLFASVALLWIMLNFLLARQKNFITWISMLLISVMATAYTLRLLLTSGFFQWIDGLVAFTAFFFVFYALFFIRNLNQQDRS